MGNNNLPEIPIENQYVGAVRQFRIWTSNGQNLTALVQSHIWSPGVNTALDISNGSGGFYGFNSLQELFKQENVGGGRIAGTYLGYGRIKVGTLGARVQHAIPEYLVDFGTMDLGPLGKLYNMKVISHDEAEELRTGVVPFTQEMLNDIIGKTGGPK